MRFLIHANGIPKERPAWRRVVIALFVSLGWLSPLSSSAEEPKPRFERDVRPILKQFCFNCHGAETPEAGLDLRTLKTMLRGGDGGTVIVSGQPDRSALLEMMVAGEMPPEGEKQPTQKQIDLIRRWIAAGLPADEQITDEAPGAFLSDEDRKHWAFQKLVRFEQPTVEHVEQVLTPVDAFLLSKLEARGLSYSPAADRSTIVRRVYLDLIGLPPSPEEVATFLADERPDAYEQLVDRLLQSPHFGEKWGRHWLDNAGYVDVFGSDNDAGIIKPLPEKYRYRDYVVQSFNEDKPFNQFLLEQLAGDELVDWRSSESFSPETKELLTATGFLLAAADDTNAPELNTLDTRHQVLQLTGEIVASNLLALTLNCAKCHNHKFDPISQRDYYRFLAIFSPAFNPDAWTVSDKRGIADVSPKQQKAIDAHNADIDRRVTELEKQQSDIRNGHKARLFTEKLTAVPEPIRIDTRKAIETAADQRDEIQKYLAEKFAEALKVSDQEIDAALTDADKMTIAAAKKSADELKSQKKTYGTIQILQDTGAPTPTYLLRRGNYLKPGREVQPGLVSVLCEPGDTSPPTADVQGSSSGRRMSLAKQLVDESSIAGGLVARVTVNRIWQRLFGVGIVASTDNFGRSGTPPTHPQLLDWLATELIREGWRIKPLIRTLMLSAAYRQTSIDDGRATQIDPDNKLLSRMRLRRLESEIVRDAILVANGKLDRTLGGPPLPLKVLPDGMVIVDTKSLPQGTNQFRRSLYVLARRNYHLSLLNTFDQPAVATNCTARKPSAVVTQSLTMLNDKFIVDQAAFLAERVVSDSADTSENTRIDRAFRLVLSRAPDDMEMAWCSELLKKQAQRLKAAEVADESAKRQALTHLCHMLLNTNEFLYIQ